MDVNFLLLKAQFEAFRNCFIGIFNAHFPEKEMLNKHLLWSFELELLQKELSCSETRLSSPEREVVLQRIEELNRLLDVAQIHGQLEKFGIYRQMSEEDIQIAKSLAEKSDLSEEVLVQLIRKGC